MGVALARGGLPGWPAAAVAGLACIVLAAVMQARARRLERALAGATRFTDQILANMREVVFRADLDGRWTFLSPAWSDLTGHPVSACLGRRMADLFDAASHQAIGSALTRLSAGETEALSLMLRLPCAHTGPREFEMTIRLLREIDGTPAGAGGIVRDMTEALRHLRALESSERRFRDLCDMAPVGIVRSDPAGRITYVNWMFELIALASRDQLVGSPLTDWLTGETGLDPAVLAQRLNVPGARIEREVRLRDGAGRPRWLTVVLTADCDVYGARIGYVGAIADVTSRKQLEHDLIDARQRAEQGAAAKSAFLANISHEIRTPMNGVIGLTELLLEAPLDRKSRRYARLIAESGATMMRLLNDVLDLAKIEAGHIALAAEPTDIRELLAGSLALMTASAARKGLAVDLDIAPDVPAVIAGDRLRLRQMLTNLIGNAVKFTDEGGITLSAHLDRDEAGTQLLVIAVADTGIGIPPEASERVFEEFVQGTAPAGNGPLRPGTGLGLAITRKLAAAMGARLTLDSVVGRGTTVSLRLPATFLPDRRKAQRRSRPAASPAPAAHALHVLVAEDNRTNQIIAAGMLGRLGHRHALVGDGAEALARAAEAEARGDPFDIVLMDMQMPGMDGLDATRNLRAAGIGEDRLPVVAVTANAFAEDVERCLAAGMQGHIAKPLQLADLAAALALAETPRTLSTRAPRRRAGTASA